MADSDRIVYPDEVEAVKEAAAKSKATEGGDTNSVEEPAPASGATPSVTTRNAISVPNNCPPGYQLVNGVCREVFD